MRQVFVYRDPSDSLGTFGKLVAGMFSCYTAEPNWHDGKRNISCIKSATCLCQIVDSPKYGKVYGIAAEGREHILIHWGNFAADPPLKSNTEGCLMLGNAIGEIGGQKALLNSKDAFRRFMDEMGNEPFTLTIKWASGVGPA